MKAEITRKGAKGSFDFIVFFFETIIITPTKAPKRKAKKMQTRILGNPREKPRNKEISTSPNPIDFS